MNFRLSWASLALQDLLEIKAFIRKDNPSAAKKEAQKIRKSVERLKRFPQSGRVFESIPTIREVIASNYRIIYRLHGNQIEILRVYHGRRSLPRLTLFS